MTNISIEFIAVVWLLLSAFVSAIGSQRQIGFGPALLIAFFFSPVVGIICAYVTPANEDIKRHEEIRLYLENLNYMYAVEHDYDTGEDEDNNPPEA